jgi:hypothetical protein
LIPLIIGGTVVSQRSTPIDSGELGHCVPKMSDNVKGFCTGKSRQDWRERDEGFKGTLSGRSRSDRLLQYPIWTGDSLDEVAHSRTKLHVQPTQIARHQQT